MLRRMVVLVGVAVMLGGACTPPAPPDPTLPPGDSDNVVYVVARNLGSVLAIDPTTLAYEEIQLEAPYLNSIAVVGNDLWYSWGSQSGAVGRYDLTTGENQQVVIDRISNSLLRPSPTDPDSLFVSQSTEIRKMDISVDPPVELARSEHGSTGSNLGDFEVSPDGTRIWVSSGAPYHLVELRTTDLGLTGKVFPTGPYPAGVDAAVVGDTTLVAGLTYSPYDEDVHVFDSSNPAIFTSYETGRAVGKGNIALSRTGRYVYSLIEDGDDEFVSIVDRSDDTSSSTPVAAPSGANSGIDVDPDTGRVFVATYNSVTVLDETGSELDVLDAIAGPSAVLVAPRPDPAAGPA